MSEEKKQNKKIFLWGVVLGAAVTVIMVFLVMFGMYLGRHADEIKMLDNGKTRQQANINNNRRQPDNQNIQLQPVSKDDWVRGNRQAKISIIEFSDTECPFCKRHHSTLQRLIDDYKGQVNWVYRHLPLTSLHSKSMQEAEATECAGELGGNQAFWSYLDRLFEITPSNNRLDLNQLPQIAAYIGLDKTKFESCLKSGRTATKVQDDLKQAQAAGARGTPFTVIVMGNTKIPVSGAVPFEQLKAIIDNLLK